MVRSSAAASTDMDDPGASSAPARLILAGEMLFATRGIEAVSLREIAAAAENGNNNAVQYHFGSKQGLVQAIFRFRVTQMDSARRRMLEMAEPLGRLGDIRTLLEILMLPLLDLAAPDGSHPYSGFMAQYLTRYRPSGMPHAADIASGETEALRELIDRLDQRLAHMPEAVRQTRIVVCNLMFHNMLVRWDSTARNDIDTGLLRTLVNDTLEMAAAAYGAPYRPGGHEPALFSAAI